MTGRASRAPQSLPQIFAVPATLGAATALGLVVALVGDGIWDVLGWIGLGTPIVVAACCFRIRTRA